MSSAQTTSTWLALGDSYTIGEGVRAEDRWPAQLAQQQGFSPPTYLAETGWTTVDLLSALSTASLAPRYDWVSVMIGVNDQYDGLGLSLYREGLNAIVDFAISRVEKPARVVVVSIPDYSITPFAQGREPARTAQEIVLFNTVVQETAGAKGVSYCDVTALSQQAATDLTLLGEDELHPSAKMYQRWAEKIASNIR